MAVDPDHLRAVLRERLERPGAGLLLDMDGTLVDSEPTHRAAFRTYFARRGWSVTDDVLARFTGRRGAEVFASVDGPWAGEDPVRTAQAVMECIDLERHPPAVVPGAGAAVRSWRSRGVPVAVVTSATRPWTDTVLELVGASGLGVLLVTAEVTERGKPDPAPYRTAAELLGVRPADCVAAEDTPAGLAAATGAGVGLVLGMSTSHEPPALLEAGAHAVVPDLTLLVD